MPPSVRHIDKESTHDACLLGFHHGTYRRCHRGGFHHWMKGFLFTILIFPFNFFFFSFSLFLIFGWDRGIWIGGIQKRMGTQTSSSMKGDNVPL